MVIACGDTPKKLGVIESYSIERGCYAVRFYLVLGIWLFGLPLLPANR